MSTDSAFGIPHAPGVPTDVFGHPLEQPPAPDPATFDLNAWVSGVASTVKSVTLYQRADLLAVADELQRRLRVAESISDDDRGMNDDSPSSLRAELEQVALSFEASALEFKVQGRSDAAREKIKNTLAIEQKITDDYEVTLHQLADAIIEPAGVTVDFLRVLGEKSEAQLKLLVTAGAMASYQAPRVGVPFSRESSAPRRGRAR